MNLITIQEEFDQLILRLKQEPVLFMDTEFYRRDTYYAKLCLVQVATKKGEYLIDTIADLDLTGLGEILSNEDIVKVFHSADQDIQIFYHLFEKVPVNLFDTQVAANICNLGDAVGYQKLCKSLLDKNIDKSLQRADWKKRPLSQDLLEYAVLDVRYLPQIYDRLAGQINALGLWKEYNRKMQRVLALETYAASPERLYSRMRVNDLQGRRYSKMISLIEFRENAAKALDVSRSHFLADHDLLKLTNKTPQSLNELEQLDIVSRHLHKKGYKAKLLELCLGLAEV